MPPTSVISPTFKSELALVVSDVLDAFEAMAELALLTVLAVLVLDVLAVLVLASLACPPQAANESTITADRAIDKSLFFISLLLL